MPRGSSDPWVRSPQAAVRKAAVRSSLSVGPQFAVPAVHRLMDAVPRFITNVYFVRYNITLTSPSSVTTIAGMRDQDVNLWGSAEHALGYLAGADSIPHRTEGEAELLEWLPPSPQRVLDLGSGDGRLLALITLARPGADAVAVDFSDTMIGRLRERFGGDRRVAVVAHDLNQPLPAWLGTFDVVASSFAIHHLPHQRKRAIYQEVYTLLRPGGVFCNLEHVASSTDSLHNRFLECLEVAPGDEDPSNKLLDVETQLRWLREIGFIDVDCHWKWRELALLAGRRALDPLP